MERRSQSPIPELPPGMTVDDLRFVNPQIYTLSMVQMGWEALIGSGIDNNPAKVSYSLSRPVNPGFDSHTLAAKIGALTEEGEPLDGYKLTVNSEEGKSPVLNFTFRGFPTRTTMDVLIALEEEFKPKDFKPMRMQLLASSEPMDEYPKSQKRGILDRARDLFRG